MEYRETARKVKEASIILGALDEETRNRALAAIADALTAEKEKIFEANRKDLEEGASLPGPILGRLKFDDHKLQDVAAGIRGMISLEDPVGKILFRRELDQDLVLTRVTCPIGVIGVILRTNRALFDVIYAAGISAGLPENFAAIIEDRAGIGEIIKCSESIDLLIPRGSNAFVKYIMDNSDIPVMGHAAGICHVYVDKDADLDKAIPIIVDAKTQYVAACNAAETLLLHKDIADQVMERLPGASKISVEYIPASSEEDFREYLDYKMTYKSVESLDEAIAHINRYGSHHTDSIVTENEAAADRFMDLVDSAGVYWNASTRFADGFRYGFGAEVGISTGKMPPRGPVGLDGLVTYKYKLKGKGHIVGDYASGKRAFHFRELT